MNITETVLRNDLELSNIGHSDRQSLTLRSIRPAKRSSLSLREINHLIVNSNMAMICSKGSARQIS